MVGLMHMCSFVLLVLSSERDFAVRLNETYSSRVTHLTQSSTQNFAPDSDLSLRKHDGSVASIGLWDASGVTTRHILTVPIGMGCDMVCVAVWGCFPATILFGGILFRTR